MSVKNTTLPPTDAADQAAVENGWPQPKGQRSWGPYAVFSTSVSTAIATWCFIIGGFASYYLPAGQGTLAVLAGSLIGILFIVLACLPVSAKYGIDAVASSVPQLGTRGSSLAVVLIYLATLGWNVYLFVLLGRAVQSIGGAFNLALPDWTVGAAGVTAVLLVLIFLRKGAASVRNFSQGIAIAVLVLAFVIMVVLVNSAGLDTLMAAPAVAPSEDANVNWASAIEILIASNLSWWAYTGAMVRNSPSARQSLWSVYLGLGLAVGVGSLTGLYGGLLIPGSGGDPTQFLVEIGGPIFGVLALTFIVLANIGTAVVGSYAATVALRQVPAVRKTSWVFSTLIAVSPALVLAGFFSQAVFDNFSIFLAFLGIAFAPICGLQIVDYFFLRRQTYDVGSLYNKRRSSLYYYWGGINPVGFLAFVAGVATYLYLLDPVTYISRAPFQFMTASIPTIVVSGVVYWVGTRMFLLPRRKGGYGSSPAASDAP
jgi:NCS1 family nucleobase:cation symporter-1